MIMAKQTKFTHTMQMKYESDLDEFIKEQQIANFQTNNTILNRSETVRQLLYDIKKIKDQMKKSPT